MFLVWVQFLVAAVIIIVAGIKLCTYADIIGDKTRLSKIFIGAIFLGIVTSLPELVTSLTSSISLDAIDLALGNVLGSNNFNLLIIVILDFLYRKGSITERVESHRSHVISAGWSLSLLFVVFLSIIINRIVTIPHIGDVGMDSILIALIYIIAVKLMPKTSTADSFESRESGTSLAGACLGFSIAAIFVVGSGMWLANIGDKIVQVTGWDQTFVGSIFLAMATSFPELAVSISALRLGSIDMAFGNIFGSNMINLFIIPIVDIFYRGGTVLSLTAKNHIVTASITILLTGIVILGLARRKKRTVLGLGWDTLIMLVIYLVGNYLLFRLQ